LVRKLLTKKTKYPLKQQGGWIMAAGSAIGRRRGFVRTVLLLVVGFSLLWSSVASANLYLKFDGIIGECTELQHQGWSVISDVSWGVTVASVVSGGGGVDRPMFQDLSWDQVMDKSFPPLFTDISLGRHITRAQVDFTTGGTGNTTYFQMVFDNVLLTSLALNGHSSGKATVDGAFDYRKIAMTYWEIRPDGSRGSPIKASYDLLTGKGSVADLGLLYGLGLEGSSSIVPIPASLWLLGSGLAGLAWRLRSRKT
jgi:type VI secretion system secreted protein Hcp